MSSPYRRKRGTPTVALNLFVAPDVKELIDEYAATADLPLWTIIEAAIRAGKPDGSGLPTNWELPHHPRLDTGINGGERLRRTA